MVVDTRGIARRFSEVDGSAAPERAITYLDAQAAHAFWREVKQASIDPLGLRAGGQGLDVGCGVGDEVRAMARLVGAGGRAVGVDASSVLITEARRRTPPDERASFEVADAQQLPFPNAGFDGIRVERTLQHVVDPEIVLAEMVRVARPGATIVAVEPDWDTFLIEAEPLAITRRVCRRWAEGIRNPAIGRMLPRLFRHAGIRAVAAEPRTWLISDFQLLDQLFEVSELAGEAIAEGSIEPASGQHWLAALGQRDRAAGFIAAVTYFLVSGRKVG